MKNRVVVLIDGGRVDQVLTEDVNTKVIILDNDLKNDDRSSVMVDGEWYEMVDGVDEDCQPVSIHVIDSELKGLGVITDSGSVDNFNPVGLETPYVESIKANWHRHDHRFKLMGTTVMDDPAGNTQRLHHYWDYARNVMITLDEAFVEQSLFFMHPYSTEVIVFDDYENQF